MGFVGVNSRKGNRKHMTTLRKEMETLTLRKEMETPRNGNIKAARSFFFTTYTLYVHGSHSTRPWISTGRGASMKRKQTNVREAA